MRAGGTTLPCSALLVLALAGCNSFPPESALRSRPVADEVRSPVAFSLRNPLPFRPGVDAAVARVGEREIRKSEVWDYFLILHQAQAYEAVRNLIDRILVEEEAARVGLELDEADVDVRLEEYLEQLRMAIRVESGGEVTLDAYLERTTGMDLETYLGHVRPVLRAMETRDRLIRYEQYLEDRATVRAIVVQEEELARELRSQVASGADLASLARRHSVHPSAAGGGLLPSFGPHLPDPIAPVAFGLEPGGVSDVIPLAYGGKSFFAVIQLVDLRKGREASYGEVSEEIEQGLRERPVDDAEYKYWSQEIGKRYDVELYF